jgi:hypothetical protein
VSFAADVGLHDAALEAKFEKCGRISGGLTIPGLESSELELEN